MGEARSVLARSHHSNEQNLQKATQDRNITRCCIDDTVIEQRPSTRGWAPSGAVPSLCGCFFWFHIDFNQLVLGSAGHYTGRTLRRAPRFTKATPAQEFNPESRSQLERRNVNAILVTLNFN